MNKHVPIESREKAFACLNLDEQALFLRLAPADQRHSLTVFRAAVTEHPDDSHLHVASLLHDVGKGRPSLFERIAFSLLTSFAPWILLKWEQRPRNSGTGRIAYLIRHTCDSAQLANLAGSHPAVVDTLNSYGFREHEQGSRLACLDTTP